MHRRASFGATGLLLLMLVSTRVIGQSVAAQSDAEATIEALQTRVAELEAQVEGQDDSRSTPATVNNDATLESSGSPYLGGNAQSLLPPGDAGELQVVAVGTYDGNVLPLVIRNNTSSDLERVAVSATARNSAGELISAGGDQGFNPNTVRPGAYTMGYAYFDGVELPAGTTFEFEVTASDASDDGLGHLDLEISEASFLGDRIVGILLNGHEEQVSGPIGVTVMCFDSEGSILGHFAGFTDKDEAAPDETVPFQVDLYGETNCTNFLVAASGYNF